MGKNLVILTGTRILLRKSRENYLEKHLGRFFGTQEWVELLHMKAGEETYIAPEKERRSREQEGRRPCAL